MCLRPILMKSRPHLLSSRDGSTTPLEDRSTCSSGGVHRAAISHCFCSGFDNVLNGSVFAARDVPGAMTDRVVHLRGVTGWPEIRQVRDCGLWHGNVLAGNLRDCKAVQEEMQIALLILCREADKENAALQQAQEHFTFITLKGLNDDSVIENMCNSHDVWAVEVCGRWAVEVEPDKHHAIVFSVSDASDSSCSSG